MNIQSPIKTTEEFLDGKRDYSPFLVHLTKDSYEFASDNEKFTVPARDVLESILEQKRLYAYNHFFPYSPNLKSQNASIINKFHVVCFTETPIEQIGAILDKSIKRKFNPEPYGLVFTKEYIKEKGVIRYST